MSKEILDGFNFFSDITQRTLSAFHLSATEDGTVEDINEMRKILVNKRKLVTCVKEGVLYRRIFSDGYEDVVEFKNIKDECEIEISTEFNKIKERINGDNKSEISKLKEGEINECEFKEIDKLGEKIFFM